jgi:hypothetical protein
MYPIIVARQLLGSVKIPLSLLGNGNSIRIVGYVVFNVVRVISRKVGDQFFPELLVLFFLSPFRSNLFLTSYIRLVERIRCNVPIHASSSFMYASLLVKNALHYR